MEIVHLILGKANPERMNGVNKVVHQLASHQAALGHQVSVWGITPTPNDAFPERNYTTQLFADKKSKFFLDSKLIKAIAAVSRQTVFHLHGGFIPQFYLAAKLIQKRRLKYFFTSHGSYNTVALQKSKLSKKLYFSCFEKSMLAKAAGLHFLGQSEYDAVDKLCKVENKFLIPNGQDLSEVSFEFQSLAKSQTPIFGFCGRLDYFTKGIDIMLDAFAIYRTQANAAGELWLIGDGTDREKIVNRIAELRLSDSVKLWGSKFGNEKFNIIANMDIFLHPSRNEGMPTAVLEAASLSIPSIVSWETNVGSYIQKHHAGWVLDNNNAEVLSQALICALRSVASQQHKIYGANAFQMVKKEFNWNNISQQLIEKYAA